MALGTKGRWIPAIVLAALTATAGIARAEDATPTSNPTQQQLLDEVRALRAEVEALKAEKKAPATTPTGASATPAAATNEPRGLGDVSDLTPAATSAAVQKDADSHGVMNGAAMSAITGWDGKGFVLSDESGNDVWRPGYILQVRNVTNWRQGDANTPDDTQNGWEIRRAKIYFTGNLFTPNLTYRFQMANQVNGSSFVLDDAWMAYQFYHGTAGKLAYKVGQFKVPVVHEEYEVGDEKQLAAERSLVNDTVGGGAIGPRSQGIDFLYNSPKDYIHAESMIHDGSGNTVGGGASRPVTTGGTTTNVVFPGNVPGSVNTDFRNLSTLGAPLWGVAGRFEWKAAGEWNDYIDFTARAVKKDLLIFGVGGDWTEGNQTHYTHASADVQYKSPSGFAVYFAALGDYTKFSGVPGFNNNFDYGGLVQVSYAIDHKIEPFFRADTTKFDDDLNIADNLVSEFTLGVNYFFGENGQYGHHAKFTLDGTYLPVGSGPVDHLGLDELANSGRNEFVVQAQFQLWL